MFILLFFLMLIFVLLLFFYIIYSKRPNTINNPSEDVDIVITWVDDNDEFKKEKDYWLAKETSDSNKNKEEDRLRFTNNQELKYCLRSIEKYLKDFRYIYLVVKDGQFPSYLRRNNSRLKIIHHSDIIPPKYLPTFNSSSIELYLHHIPNLSINYLFFNDDFMLLKELKKSFFLMKNNFPYLFHSDYKMECPDIFNFKPNDYDFETNWKFNCCLLDKLLNKKEKRYFLVHAPKMWNKHLDFDIEKRLKKIFIDKDINCYDKTGLSKFRRNDNLLLNVVVKNYLYKKGKFKKVHVLEIDFNKENQFNIKSQFQFLCIRSVHPDYKEKYFNFMDHHFPKKSSFEL